MNRVPKLRFKEFSGDWEEKNILELCSMKARIGWQNLRKEEHLESGEFYLVTGTDFYLERIKWETAKYVDEERYLQDKNIILKEGDILITKDGSIGKLAFIENIKDRKVTLNNGIFRIRIEKEEQYSKYLFYTFLSNRFKLFLQQLTAGSTIVHLYQKDFEKYAIAYPKLKEQQKIADFLSSVDKKISITEEKLDLFKEYKKGVMQKIFKQELRFKDSNGNDYPKWEKIKIGKVLTERKEYSEKNDNFPHLSLTKDGVLPKSERYERDFLVKDEEKMYKITRLNDICYNPANLKFGVICRNDLGDGIFSPIYITFIVKEGTNSEYLNLYIKYSDFIKRARKYEEGTVYERMAVKCSDFIKTEINLPCLEEQQRIADFLSAIDTKIEKISDELENLKDFKKGLLQQMFI